MDSKTGLGLVFLTAIISGFSIFMNAFAVKGVNSDLFVFTRSILVAGLLALVLLATSRLSVLRSLSKRQWGSLAFVGLVGGSVPFLLFFKGLQLTSAASASFLQKTMFLPVAVLGLFVLKEKLDKRFFVPALLLLAGNFFLLNGAPADLGNGNLLIMAATLLWAVENVVSKRLLAGMNAEVLALGRMGFGALFVLPYLFFANEANGLVLLSVSQLEWIAVSSLVLFAYVWTWYNGLKQVSATAATSILLVGSPLTSLFSFAFAGASISSGQALGTVLVLAGVGGILFLYERSLTLSLSRSRSG